MMFFRRKSAAPAALLPDGHRVYAIGDVHGCLRELAALIDAIAADGATRDAARTHIVMLGDLIDRGPDSAGVIRFLLDAPVPGTEMHFLCGNHEATMIAALRGDHDARDAWLGFGGDRTLLSYGVPQAAIATGGAVLDQAIARAVPGEHLRFLEAMNESIVIGDYVFVHAGIRPGVPLDDQCADDLLWIRAEFLDSTADHGAMIVHGHSISGSPEFRGNRIGIDTGAYRTGVLTALGLEREQRWLLST